MAASTVAIGGRRTATPGAYGSINPSSLARRGPGIKRLVILGTAEGGTPVTVLTEGRPTLLAATTPGDVKTLFRSGMLRDAGLAAFDASNDAVINGPSQIIFAKVNPATQGSATLSNAAGVTATVTSAQYGAFVNFLNFSLGLGTTKGYSVAINAEALDEAGDDIGGDAAFSARYDNSAGDFNAVSLIVDGTGIRLTFTDQYAAAVVTDAHVSGEVATVVSANAYDTVQRVTVYGVTAGNVPTSDTIALNGASIVSGTVAFGSITGWRVDGATRGTITVSSTPGTDVSFTLAATITANHTSGNAVEVVSASALDVGIPVTVTGTSVGGVAISETITLNGTTAVAGTRAFGKVLTARLASACAGSVTIREITAGPTAFVIAAASLTAGINLAAGIYIPVKAVFNGPISLKHTVAPAGSPFVVVRGITTAGVVAAERKVLTGAYSATTTSWATITQIERGMAEAANAVDITGTAINAPATSYPYLGQVIAKIAASPGFEATALVDGSDTFPLARLDFAEASVRVAAAVDFFADGYAIEKWVNENSALVTYARPTGSTGAPFVTVSPVYIVGGGEGTATQADWQAAIDALKRLRDVVVAVCSTSASVAAAWVSHAKYMEGAGNEERNGYIPIALTRTKAQLRTDIRALNDRNTQAIAQGVIRYSEAGVRTTYGPEVLAAMAGAMQAGAAIAMPLTRKRINALGLTQHSIWDPTEDRDEMILMGLMFGEVDDEVGARWVRDVTTWRNDDNPVFSAGSANESINECLRRSRRNLDLLVGSKAFDGFASTVKEKWQAELDDQVAGGVIKAYRNVEVLDAGDTFPLEAEVAAIEGVNFIPITLNLNRIPASAAA